MSKYFTIFGNPISHSISPLIHNYTIKTLQIDGCYGRTLLKNGNDLKKKFLNLNLTGANITVPFKENAYNLCDKVEGIAQNIQAVNTIIKKNNKLIGFNTDASGFYESIKSYKNIKNILILGAGGTAKAISFILKQKGYKVTLLNRSQKRLDFFIENNFECYYWDNFIPTQYDMIINTTSAGLNDLLLPAKKDILDKLFTNAKYAVDVIYNKQTPFLSLAKKHNLIIKDGSDMLLYQAILAFEIFFDFKYSKNIIEKPMKYAFKFLL